MTLRTLVVASGLALAVTSAGCAAGKPGADQPPPAAVATSAGVNGVSASEFGGTDLAWVELMIPMDEQLLPVLDLVTQRATDPGLARLAGDLRGVYQDELPRLRALSQRAGLPADNPHKGHKMPGLVDADRLAAIGNAGGAEFQRQVTECLREHLDQLASLARSELANGTSPTVKDLAQKVADTRTGYRAQLPA